jgi:hypothetical protein
MRSNAWKLPIMRLVIAEDKGGTTKKWETTDR